MSSCFWKPFVTPSTMLATRVRERPWSALWRGSSDGRETVTSSFASATVMSAGSVRDSSPRGPFTFTVLPSTETVTPLVTGTGFFPIRDIVVGPGLVDDGQELAAGPRLARLAVRHDPLRGAQDRHPEPVAYARDLGDADVLAQPGGRHALQVADDRLATLRVLEDDAQQGAPFLALDRPEVGDVVVLLQDPGDLDLQLGGRHVHAAVLRSAGIADPREHIGDRVGHAHV